ncbi:unnamed protein product [Malus baccata var. baccata]
MKKLTVDPQVVTMHTWGVMSLVGVQRNNTLLLILQQRKIPTLWCDNVSTISLASNLVFHARTKHIKIDYHYIRGLVLAHLLNVHYVNGQHQIVDIHTKSLRSKFNIINPSFLLVPIRSA